MLDSKEGFNFCYIRCKEWGLVEYKCCFIWGVDCEFDEFGGDVGGNLYWYLSFVYEKNS